MKKIKNQSPKAAQQLIDKARSLGITAEILDRSNPRTRRHHPLGSTAVAQKIVIFNGIAMSVGQAREYIAARSSRRPN